MRRTVRNRSSRASSITMRAGRSVALQNIARVGVMRLDLAEFWALLIFALNYIPYIGAWLGVIFPTLLAAAQFGDPGRVFGIAAALAVVQFTTGSVLEPRVMGRGLNLSPVIMLLSLGFWGTVWGVVGMLLAVPLMVVIMIVCAHVDSLRPVA